MSNDSDPPTADTDPARTEQTSPEHATGGAASPPRSGWGKLRKVLLRVGAVLGGFVFLLVILTGAAGWYTSRPEFCRSCHYMEPYYQSWVESTHKDVSCIECHFAPGLGGKVRGKMLGLVQLTKYVTASEGPRPAAEIPDASCLRSGCHETRLLSGKVEFHGILFDHAPHMEELRRGKKLRCTSCHSQIVQGTHMSVTPSTCFLCHFKGGLFDEGVGTCTRCHQIPEEPFEMGGGITFSHDLALKRGVDCINCHRDVIRGDGAVPRQQCRSCHNREADLERFDDDVFMHKTHVTDHKIDCTHCHLEIEHSLDEQKLEHSASNCEACHSDPHAVQVEMFQGVGARTVPNHPGGMTVTRIDCRSCHAVLEQAENGAGLRKASADMCQKCHESFPAEKVETFLTEANAAMSELQASLDRVRQRLKERPESVSPQRLQEIGEELTDVQADLDFLAKANAIHNSHYATTLTEELLKRLVRYSTELGIPAPEVTLPSIVPGQ